MVIGIDARPAAEVLAGEGRHVRELLRALALLPEAADDRFILYARKPWAEADLDERFTWRLLRGRFPTYHLRMGAAAGREVDVLLSISAFVTAWFTTAPVATVIPDLVPSLHPDLAKRGPALIDRLTLPRAVRRSGALVCISQSTAHDVVQAFPESAPKLCTILHGVRPPEPPPEPARRDRPYVLAVGTLQPRKNLEALVAAWADLEPALRAEHDLLLVGPRGWESADVIRRAAEIGAVLPGRVSDEELASLYAGATAFVYPSLYEGFGLPVLEAMAAGAPTIASSTSSLPEIAGDAALLVDPRDTAALAEALRRLITEPALREELRARGLARVPRFTWERTARETLAVLHELGAAA